MSRPRHPFAAVDEQRDPREWIGVLDRLRSDPLYARYKARVAELLDPAPGRLYLEVGAGTGADALDLVRRYGADAVAVDGSTAMVDEARRRGLGRAVHADAHSLPFDSGHFDGAWADRTFQHLADPAGALAEMTRVVRAGGRLVVADPDYGTQVAGIDDQDLADRVLRFRAGVGNWRLGHQMRRLFVRAGLTGVETEAVPIVVTDPTALDNALGLRSWAALAGEQGLLPPQDVSRWEHAIDEAVAGGWFLYSFCIFITAGRRPDGRPYPEENEAFASPLDPVQRGARRAPGSEPGALLGRPCPPYGTT